MKEAIQEKNISDIWYYCDFDSVWVHLKYKAGYNKNNNLEAEGKIT